MLKVLFCRILFIILLTLPGLSFAQDTPSSVKTSVYIIPIEGQISNAQFFIIRRALKQAVENNIDAVVLKINTPGGDLKSTLKIMEALDNFKGTTITFVSKEAMSAGAYIAAATNEIYFHPQGILGAAAVIQATGQEVSESLKQKIDSYLRARVRSYTQEHRYRGDVIRAMMDDDFVLKIDGQTIKDKGELLTLTAQEAVKEYGSPPEKLFGAGIFNSTDDLLNSKFGSGQYEVKDFLLTWSEDLARWLTKITPILLGLGLLLLFIEFKTPGFGIFGISGIVLLLVVFASSYVAGLAGHEAILVFAFGIILLAVELFILPGIMVAGILGLLMIFGSIIWALADIWPNKDFKFTFDLFLEPIIDLAIGLIIAISGIFILGRYFLKSWLWNILVLKSTVGAPSTPTISQNPKDSSPQVGSRGIAITDLHPAGEVQINNIRYQAKVNVGEISKKSEIEVVQVTGFGLIVKEVQQ